MATTTTNFGWTVPSDTDLVKDGAAAIRTALGGVDTSFVDLKGGTTGQALLKASGTDLDFSWGSVASGLTLISRTAVSGAVAYNIDSVFDANTYTTYRIVFEKGFAAAAQRLQWQLRYGSTTQTTGYYTASYGYKYTGVTLANAAVANGSYFHMGGPGATNLSVLDLSILGNTAYYNGQITTNDDGTFFAGGYNQSMGGTISGLRLITGGGTDNISGTISIYGMAI